jgi:hypothetical protein
MAMDLPVNIDIVKGFLAPDEGEELYRLAREVAPLSPCLEVGSYCGKSTVYLGTACQEKGSVLYAVDHHRGSEEHQRGEEYHDPDLFDEGAGVVDSFREFRTTLRTAGLEDSVVPIVSTSAVAARQWATPLGMVFIDGGHSLEAALCDYRCWAGHIVTGESSLFMIYSLIQPLVVRLPMTYGNWPRLPVCSKSCRWSTLWAYCAACKWETDSVLHRFVLSL